MLITLVAMCTSLNAATLSRAPAAPHLDSRTRLAALSGGQVEEPESAPPAPELAPTKSEKLASEFFGTFLLVLSVVCAGAQQAALAPLAVACILTGLIYAFGHISGAIFNPAVSVALILRGSFGVHEALEFAIAQIGGAMAAGLAGRVLYGVSIAPATAAPLALANWLRAAFSEVLFTFTIVTVVLHAATTKAMAGNSVVSLAIGLTVFGCAVCSSGASGSVFNPAVGTGLWLAKAVTGDGFSAYHTVLYIVGPIIGGALATGVFKLATCPRED